MSQQLTLSSLPLFPLNTVLFPDGELALRVFEVRYLDMVRKCHQAGAPFGVVALESGSEVHKAGAQREQLYLTGTLANIEELQTPQPGLMTVRCRGSERFHITDQRLLGHGLWVADVSMMPPDQTVPVPEELQSCSQLLANALLSLRERSGDTPSHTATPTEAQLNDCAWVSNRWCELLPLPLELKQRLMSLDNPLARLELVSDILDKTGISR